MNVVHISECLCPIYSWYLLYHSAGQRSNLLDCWSHLMHVLITMCSFCVQSMWPIFSNSMCGCVWAFSATCVCKTQHDPPLMKDWWDGRVSSVENYFSDENEANKSNRVKREWAALDRRLITGCRWEWQNVIKLQCCSSHSNYFKDVELMPLNYIY